jgi:hypothetical protein
LEAKDSQQEPTEDSGLQTPQPDQPIPTDQERFEQQQREAQAEESLLKSPDKPQDAPPDSPPVQQPSTEPPGGSQTEPSSNGDDAE